jgi:hypothetical protein
MAATGIVSGKDGSITFASGYVVNCTAWTLNITAEDVVTTPIGGAWATRLGGVKDWSGTFTCVVDSSSLASIEGMNIGAAAATADFTFDATATTDGEFSGTIVITGADVSVGANAGPSTVTFTFGGSGALSITAAA